MRLLKICDDNFINASCGASLRRADEGNSPDVVRGGFGFDKLAEDDSSGFECVLQAEDRMRNGDCFRTRQTDNADTASSGRRRDGDNGVVKVHNNILIVGLDALVVTQSAVSYFLRESTTYRRPPSPSLAVCRSSKSRSARCTMRRSREDMGENL